MKKHMVSAVLLLIMMLSLSAQAAEMRVITCYAQELLKYLVVYQIYLSQPKCAVVKGRLFLT